MHTVQSLHRVGQFGAVGQWRRGAVSFEISISKGTFRESTGDDRELGRDIDGEEGSGEQRVGAGEFDRDHDMGGEAQVPRTVGVHSDDPSSSKLIAAAENGESGNRPCAP